MPPAWSNTRLFDIIDYLHAGDVLVINQTRVIPARLYGVKEAPAGQSSSFPPTPSEPHGLGGWPQAQKAKPGARFVRQRRPDWEIPTVSEDGGRTVRFFYEGVFEDVLDRLGRCPCRRNIIHEKLEDKTRYQTVYAKVDGSAAAPTAGFTSRRSYSRTGSGRRALTSCRCCCTSAFRHVPSGQGDDVADHHMHSEYYEVTVSRRTPSTPPVRGGAHYLRRHDERTHAGDRRDGVTQPVHAGSGFTQIFITPGVKIKAVDALTRTSIFRKARC